MTYVYDMPLTQYRVQQEYSATMAIVGQVPFERLWHAIPSFPTVSEVWIYLLET